MRRQKIFTHSKNFSNIENQILVAVKILATFLEFLFCYYVTEYRILKIYVKFIF